MRTEARGPVVAAEAGLVAAHLDDLAGRVPIESIDQVWVFPTRTLGSTSSTVVAVSAFAEGEGRRRILTAHYTARRERRGHTIQVSLVEHGEAPADRIGRLIDGVLRRLNEDFDAAPHAAEIAGEAERWLAWRASLETTVEATAAPQAG